MTTTATARVEVLLEVPISQDWPANATIEEIHDRAAKEAVQWVRAMTENRGVRVVGATRVTAVLVDKAAER